MLAIPSRVIATCFALVSFAAAVIAGFAAGNRLLTVMIRAMLVMLAAWIVGMVLGAIAQRTVDEHIESFRQGHPIPSDDVEQDVHVEDERSGEVDASTQGVAASASPAERASAASTQPPAAGPARQNNQPNPPRMRQATRERTRQPQAA